MPTKRTLSGGFSRFLNVHTCTLLLQLASRTFQHLLCKKVTERNCIEVTNSGNIWSFGQQKSGQAKTASSTSVKETSWSCTEATRGGKNGKNVERRGKMESCFGCSQFGRFL